MDEDGNPRFETVKIKKPHVKRRFGMNWKALLTAFVIVAIGVLMLSTNAGQRFAGQALELFKVSIGNFASGLVSGGNWQLPFGIFGGNQMPTGTQFMVVVDIPKEAFNGQKYTVANTTSDLEGLCDSGIKVGELTLKTESMECSIALDEMKGEFEYTTVGTLKFSGDVSKISVNGNSYSSASRIKTSFEAIPSGFVLVGLVQPKVVIQSATGSLEIRTREGLLKSSTELTGEKLEIGGFIGFIKLEESNIKLQGLAVSVKGIGEHNSFSWPA